MEHDEAALLRAWAAGERSAGERLFARYYKPLTRFFINKVRSSAEVEDLVQRSFVAMLESASRYRGDASARTWVFAIARNLLRQFYDQRRREARVERSDDISVADFDAPGVSTLVRGKAEQKLLLLALRSLPLETQVMLELFYWEDMRSRDIGAILGMPEGTVRSQLRKARGQLELELGKLSREPALVESTLENLEGWARELRELWGLT